MTTKAEKESLQAKAKEYLESGYTINEIANKVGRSESVIRKWLKQPLKTIKRGIILSNQREIPELRGMKQKFEQKHTPQQMALEGYSTYEYSNDSDIGESGVKCEQEGVFSRAMLNIPYINYTPAKRIHQVCGSLYDWKRIEGEMRAFSRFVPLDYPEVPLYIDKVKYHDADTLNATIGIAENEADKHFTALDACIISQDFANRFVSTQQYRQTIFTKQYKIGVGDKVTGGEIYEEFINPMLTQKNVIKATGTVVKVINTKQTNVCGEIVNIHNVVIKSTHKLRIGDKLRSMSGLKVVIGEVREANGKRLKAKGKPLPPSPDIIININQIAGKTNIKGSLLKEILNHDGKVAVGMRMDESLGNNENLHQGSSISITLYPVLKIYDSELLTRILAENYGTRKSYLKQLLMSLHLRINDLTGIIEIEPETQTMLDDSGEYADVTHYLWNTNTNVNQPHKRFITNVGGKEIQMNKHVWETLFIPDFILPFYVSGTTIRNETYIECLNIGWEERLSIPSKGKCPFIVKSRGGESNYKKILKDALFPKLHKGKFLRAIPQHKDIDYVEIGLDKDFGEDGHVTIFREPVVNEFSVWCLPVVHNPNLPKYVIRIPPKIILAMNGDYDGDDVCVIPYNSEAFKHKGSGGERRMTNGERDTDSLDPLPSLLPKCIFRDSKEIMFAGIKEMNYEQQRQRDVRNFGGLRNRIALELEDRAVHIKLLTYATGLETILKPERSAKGEYKAKIAQLTKEMRELFPTDLRADKGKSSYISLLQTYGKRRVIDVENLLGYDTRTSEFWKELWV